MFSEGPGKGVSKELIYNICNPSFRLEKQRLFMKNYSEVARDSKGGLNIPVLCDLWLTQEFGSVPKDPGAFILQVWQSKDPVFLDCCTLSVRTLVSSETSWAAGPMTARRTQQEWILMNTWDVATVACYRYWRRLGGVHTWGLILDVGAWRDLSAQTDAADAVVNVVVTEPKEAVATLRL